MIRFFCPTCQARVQAPAEKAGVGGRCPKCGRTFFVPRTGMVALSATASPADPAYLGELAPVTAQPAANELPDVPFVEAPPTATVLIEAPLTEAPTRSSGTRAIPQRHRIISGEDIPEDELPDPAP